MKLPPQPKTKSGTHIEAHGYDPKTGTLTVTFRGGRSYRYDAVAPEVAKGLANAQSKGTFIHRFVIGKHKATKL